MCTLYKRRMGECATYFSRSIFFLSFGTKQKWLPLAIFSVRGFLTLEFENTCRADRIATIAKRKSHVVGYSSTFYKHPEFFCNASDLAFIVWAFEAICSIKWDSSVQCVDIEFASLLFGLLKRPRWRGKMTNFLLILAIDDRPLSFQPFYCAEWNVTIRCAVTCDEQKRRTTLFDLFF